MVGDPNMARLEEDWTGASCEFPLLNIGERELSDYLSYMDSFEDYTTNNLLSSRGHTLPGIEDLPTDIFWSDLLSSDERRPKIVEEPISPITPALHCSVQGDKACPPGDLVALTGNLLSGSASDATYSTESESVPSSQTERRYHCGKCNTSFALKYNLTKHVRNVHQRRRPFSCELCPATFQQKNHMVKHTLTVHEHQRPFQCKLCDQSFGWQGVLVKHVALVHEKKRPHVCETCNAAFQQKSHLSNHVSAVHLKQRLFKCEQCPLAFGRKEILTRHCKRKHKASTI